MYIIKIVKELLGFINEIYESKHYLIYKLVKRDFKNKYMGSVLGLIWAILQPLMVIIMWFIFTFGLKAGRGSGRVPFVCYLFTGMVVWNFFSDSLSGSTNVIAEHTPYSKIVKHPDDQFYFS